MTDDPKRWALDFNSFVYADRKAPRADHALDFAWLLKASRRAVEDEKAQAGLRSFMSFAQAQAALVIREQFRVRLKPTVRWRWGINYGKAAGHSMAAALYGSVATRK